MAAPLSVPFRQTQADVTAQSDHVEYPEPFTEKLPLHVRGKIIVIALLAPWVFILGGVTLAGL